MGAEQDGMRDLAARLRAARTVDDVAEAALRALMALPGAVRAALALTVVGGRQLRFLSSDEDRLGPPPRWCLVDAYDSLPLNDAIRTGRDVLLATPGRFAQAYPELAARQSDTGVRGVVALALRDGDRRLGGLLVYGDRDLPAPGSGWHHELLRVAGLVTAGLLALERAREASPDVPAARRAGAGPHRVLPGDETAPGIARRFLRAALATWRVDDDVVDAALLCASELVTNVVMHAGRPSVITLRRVDDSLTVRVHQSTEGPVPPRRVVQGEEPLRVAGRGLELVEATAADWGTDTTAEETSVWFRLRLPAAARPR